VLVGTETRTIYTIPWSDSYTQSPYYVLAFGYPVIYGGSVGQYTEVQWSEMYSFELTHNTWIGLNLSNGVYYGQSGDWAPYYSSYEASATVGALVKDDKPFELNAAAYSIAFRPLKCGYRGESLFDRSEEFYRYGSYPDGLRESGKLDLLETPASGELRDFIKSVGIGR
jgi:hypothetical protein